MTRTKENALPVMRYKAPVFISVTPQSRSELDVIIAILRLLFLFRTPSVSLKTLLTLTEYSSKATVERRPSPGDFTSIIRPCMTEMKDTNLFLIHKSEKNYNIYLVCGNTMRVSTCQVEFVLKRTVLLDILRLRIFNH